MWLICFFLQMVLLILRWTLIGIFHRYAALIGLESVSERGSDTMTMTADEVLERVGDILLDDTWPEKWRFLVASNLVRTYFDSRSVHCGE